MASIAELLSKVRDFEESGQVCISINLEEFMEKCIIDEIESRGFEVHYTYTYTCGIVVNQVVITNVKNSIKNLFSQ